MVFRDRVIAMRKVVVLCAVSAVLGAVLAIVLSDPPVTEPTSVAQDPQRVPAGGTPPGLPVGPASQLSVDLDELTPEERISIAIYESYSRSVVNITTTTVRSDPFRLFQTTSEGEGSGSVIDRQGHILTNFHVIERAQQAQVTLSSGKSYDARLVGRDPANDTAILKIDAPADELFPVVFGDSSRLRVGQRVYAIGSPFGLEQTYCSGMISSLNRSLPSRRKGRIIKSIIQIDANINPGSSGGPLLDTRGRVIGMNTAIASKTGESAGVGFAIPINIIARIVPQLIASGHVARPDIGIAQVVQTAEGLLIAKLTPGGPAERAGLLNARMVSKRIRRGPLVYESRDIAADKIVAVDDQPVRTVDDFLTIIEDKQPGDQVAVKVVRDGKEVTVRVTLEPGE